MQSRRSVAGRPSGTDGSDFSYRMVVDSRYTRVASGKSRLSWLLLVQAIIFVASALSTLFPVLTGDEHEVISLSAAGVSLMSLLIGELGRRRSRSGALKIYMVLSSVSMVLFIVCTVNRELVTQLVEGQISSSWEKHKLQIIKALLALTDITTLSNVSVMCVTCGARIAGSLVQVVTVSTTITLISNMSLPKRSS